MNDFKKRTVLVGGASKGLGFGCAEAFAEKGMIVIMCARSEAALVAAAKELQAKYPKSSIRSIPCDWSKKEDLVRLKEKMDEENIEVDIVVNNTGGPLPGTVTEQTEEAWKASLDLLFWSTVRVYGMVLPGMRARKWGRIINILSTTVVEPVPNLGTSSVIRAALASYSKLTASEVSKEGITVNSVMPGGFMTDRTKALLVDTASRRGITEAEVLHELEQNLPLGRFMKPVELGRVIAFLASDEAAGITGALLPVDGGALRSV